MSNRTKKIDYTLIEAYSQSIAEQIQEKEDGQIDAIVILTRGGLIPGYFIARELGVRDIRTISLSSYTKDREKTHLHEICEGSTQPFDTGMKWLIVDDLADSGETLKYVTDKYFSHGHSYLTATLICKEGTKFIPDYYACAVPSDLWIEFEYEND